MHNETDENVLVEIADTVATVTLNRPAVRNAFDEQTIERLAAIWTDLAAHDRVRTVVLKGQGPHFCAGADLAWMRKAATLGEDENRADALKLSKMLDALYNLPQTTIACVFGAAMGGGLGLVSCCDIVIADREAKFALSEVRLGLIPATISPYVIRAIGARQARRFFQTGERFGAATAYHVGLVHEVADRPEDVEYMLHKTLQDIGKNGPEAMRAAKRLCLDFAERPVDETVLKETAERIAAIRTSDEAQEGLSAFLQKRDAAWVKG